MAVLQIQEILSKIYCRIKNLKIKELIDVQSDYGECKQVLKSYGNDTSSCCTCTPSIKAYWANIYADEVLCKVVDNNANINHNISPDTNCQVAINYLLIRDLELTSYIDETKTQINERITTDFEELDSRIVSLEASSSELSSQIDNLNTTINTTPEPISGGSFTLVPGSTAYKRAIINMRMSNSDLDTPPSYGEQEPVNYIRDTFSYTSGDEQQLGIKSVLFRFEHFGSIMLDIWTSHGTYYFSVYKNDVRIVNIQVTTDHYWFNIPGIVPGDVLVFCPYTSYPLNLNEVKIMIIKPSPIT